MTYEYLKGMGATDTLQVNAGVSNKSFGGGNLLFNNFGAGTASPPPASPPAGGTRKTIADMNFGAGTGAGAGSPSPNLLAFAVAAVPKTAVPSGSVTTKPEERAGLKEWCRQIFGQNGAFYKEKLAKDPSFTYMNANTLARYRNGVETVVDMIRGQGDSAVTVGDVAALKAWWLKCHKETYFIFSLRYKDWGKSDTWVPLKLSTAWKVSFKATGACPNARAKKLLFEYLAHTLASDLLKEEAAKKRLPSLLRRKQPRRPRPRLTSSNRQPRMRRSSPTGLRPKPTRPRKIWRRSKRRTAPCRPTRHTQWSACCCTNR